MVESPPANAGDVGSSPGLGRSHMPRSSWARAPQLLNLCSGALEPRLLSLCITTTEARAPRACAPQRRVAPARRNSRKPASSNKDPVQPKINKFKKKRIKNTTDKSKWNSKNSSSNPQEGKKDNREMKNRRDKQKKKPQISLYSNFAMKRSCY